MNYGFVKVAAAIPHVKVADCFYNIQQIEGLLRQAAQKDVQIIAFPELSITSYTCMDLFSQEILLRNAEKALLDLVNATADLDLLAIVGCPLVSDNQLINAAVVFRRDALVAEPAVHFDRRIYNNRLECLRQQRRARAQADAVRHGLDILQKARLQRRLFAIRGRRLIAQAVFHARKQGFVHT